MAQIDMRLLVHGNEPATRFVYLLSESERDLTVVDFFEVAGASAGAACVFANLASSAIR
jgi:hypothetical protein